MAREIIQMYDKYHSTKKVYPKVVEECLPEEYAGLPDAVEDLEDALGNIPEVVANPELAGTEGDLEGLQVGDTKYKIGGGKQLYQHNITINHQDGGVGSITMQIINDSETAFTLDSLWTYLHDNFSYDDSSNKKGLACNGLFNINSTTYLCIFIFYYPSSDFVRIGGVNISGSFNNIYNVNFSFSSSQASLTDAIIAL